MFQGAVTTTTPPMAVVYSGASSLLWLLPWSQWFAITADAKGHKRSCLPHHCVTAATSVPDASSGICQLCHGSFTGKFLIQSSASHQCAYYVGVHYGVCFLLSGAILDAIFTNGGSTIGVCTTVALWSIHMADIFASW